jgi:hypothetical protein
MATGLSIHIGLNEVDPGHYGSSMPLGGCVNDANDMAALAGSVGFQPTLLTDGQATAAAVTDTLTHAAGALGNGDILLVTYSGHGGFVPDTNQDENDGRDETWCLFDRQMPDDELYGLWSAFGDGVRILVLSDSCHSGSVVKFARDQAAARDRMAAEGGYAAHAVAGEPPRVRAISAGNALQIFQNNAQRDLDVESRFPRGRGADVRASVLLISACQDWELSYDGSPNGVFTGALLRTWNRGAFQGTYPELHAAIHAATQSVQRPNYFKAGVPNPAFEAQRAFSI